MGRLWMVVRISHSPRFQSAYLTCFTLIGRALKVEIVYDGIPGPVDQAPPVVTPALLGRLGGRISDEPTNLKVSPSKPALTLCVSPYRLTHPRLLTFFPLAP